jgi:pimeloyl-ACP methyl ester carboxylesterase
VQQNGSVVTTLRRSNWPLLFRVNWQRLVSLGLILVILPGCSSTQWARMRSIPRNPLTQTLKLNSRSGPQPTPATQQLLRQYDLVSRMDEPERLVADVQGIAATGPTPDRIYAIAELAYIGAKRREAQRKWTGALDLFGTAVVNSYVYLFDNTLDGARNPYDPRFRRACDLYNASLESTLRYLQQTGSLFPGATRTIRTGTQVFDVCVASRGTWHEANFCELRFVSDFDVKELRNHYRTYGLGVPMIATYQSTTPGDPQNRFYPPGMSFPVTAFLRVKESTYHDEQKRYQCVVELHDPTSTAHIEVNRKLVPLEIDLTTPLAYSLDNPAFRRANEPTQGLRNSEASAAVSGLYMLEPYQPGKIPVVMIHGFWSSLVTWMEMFNDLRGSPEIRERFQFWFYLYPSGQPFWYAAAHLREQLTAARQTLDPIGKTPTLDQMVLIGHSAGGLIAELQTLSSGDDFWHLVSADSIETVSAPAEQVHRLRRTFYFRPDKSVRRVVTIATPHLGSNFSNQTTQWLSHHLIDLPDHVRDLQQTLNDPSRFGADSLVNITTNVEAMAPGSPFLLQMRVTPHPRWVRYHNIVGLLPQKTGLSATAANSDGVVTLESAHFPQAVSEIQVNASHPRVHRHPLAILEVRRILMEHLRSIDEAPIPPPPLPIPVGASPVAASPLPGPLTNPSSGADAQR